MRDFSPALEIPILMIFFKQQEINVHKQNLQQQRLKQPTWLIFCMVVSTGLNSLNHEKLANCLYPCPDIHHLMIVTKKTN